MSMKKLLIYYSLTGNGDLLSEHLSKQGYEVRKVIEKKKMPKSVFWMIMIGGFRAGFNFKGKLVDYNNDVKEYDEVVIGSPIWNGKTTPAINSVLKQTDLTGKKLTFVFYSGSGEGKKAEKKIKKLYPESTIIFLKEPKKYNEQFDKIKSL